MSTARRSQAQEREAALMVIGTSLATLERAYRAAASQAVAHVGVSQALAWPLVTIGRHGDGLRQGVLADILHIEGPSLARSVEQLASAGFIERREDPADRRAKTLYLTDKGVQACAHIEAALIDLRNQLYAGIPDEDIAGTLRVFATLRERLGLAPAHVPPPPRPEAAKSSGGP
jgi:MarR family transcriptional regulator for hemolysin